MSIATNTRSISAPGHSTKRIIIPDDQLKMKGAGKWQHKVLPVTDLVVKSIDGGGRTVSGYAATWDPDLVDDVILRGAFAKTIRDRGPRLNANGELRSQIKFCNEHKQVIGLPLLMKEDFKGLWVQALISLTRLGKDCIELVKDGTIDSMSIGYDVVQFDYDEDKGLRILKELKLYEFSLVANPANTEAEVAEIKAKERQQNMDELQEVITIWTSVGKSIDNLTTVLAKKEERKSKERKDVQDYFICGATNLPFADADEAWDEDKAMESVYALAGGDEDASKMDWDTVAKANLVCDKDESETKGGYHLPFAKAVKGKLVAVPKAIEAIAGALDGGRGGFKAPDNVIKSAKAWVSKQYIRMGEPDPFKDSGKDKGKSLQASIGSLSSEVKSFGSENKAHAHTRDAAARLMTAANTLMDSSGQYGSYYSGGSGSDSPPPNEVVKHVVDILADTAEGLQKNCMNPESDEQKTAGTLGSETKSETKKGRMISAANQSVIEKAIDDLQKLIAKMAEDNEDHIGTDDLEGKSLDEAADILSEAMKAATQTYSWSTQSAPES